MAYLVKHERSPFWYVRFRDLDSGKWREENLKLRIGDPKESAKAVKEAAGRSRQESQVAPLRGEAFVDWVPDYLKDHYRNPRTLARSEFFWATVHVWLFERGIRHPREIQYKHAQDYMDWRTGIEGDEAGHNTARMEVKFLSFLISEAIRRGYAESNPIGLARIPIKQGLQKREMTTAEIVAVREELKRREKETPWMRTVFELLLHLGCRFGESRIPKARIDFTKKTIQICDSKRQEDDPRKWFTAPLNDQLASFLGTIDWHDGHTTPLLGKRQYCAFHEALDKAAPGITSHCCRVGFISRCHRAGLSESEAMRLVNHSTRMVHRIYSRLNVEDARSAMLRVPLPPPL